jgi:hypothetical protein
MYVPLVSALYDSVVPISILVLMQWCDCWSQVWLHASRKFLCIAFSSFSDLALRILLHSLLTATIYRYEQVIPIYLFLLASRWIFIFMVAHILKP